MNTTFKMLALSAFAMFVVAGSVTSQAEAKGFGNGGHHGGSRFGGHHFGGTKFSFGHQNCWRFGKWICGPGGY